MTMRENGSGLIYMTTTTARWFQLFRYEDDVLTNDHGKIVSIQNDHDRENMPIMPMDKKE
jgi:hypothetical protein